MEKIIRQATIEDSAFIAQAILLALGMNLDNLEEESYWGDDSLILFSNLARREDSQYSYKNTLVCEVEGEVAGVLIAYEGAKLYSLREALFNEVERMNLAAITGLEDETEPGEYYIDSLTVFAEFRGRGIATMLINSAVEEACKRNIHKVGLIVDKENPNAAKLYTKLGFKYVKDKMFLGHEMEHLQKDVIG
jgi:ribosomal protein S18 acetylase RimI-like enzyme